MTHTLTTGQRALLAQALQLRLHEIEQRRAQHPLGLNRVAQAQALRDDDADDTAQHAADREVGQALGDLALREQSAIGDALKRLQDGSYGACAQCEKAIPFARLTLEPWALRCVACESAHEQAHGLAHHRATL